jgi:superfamily II DNA or RNA helicase
MSVSALQLSHQHAGLPTSVSRPLRAWQSKCLEKLTRELWPNERRALIVATPGAGKTTLALTFARERIRASEIDHVHVVAPTRPLRQHWQDAAREFGLSLGRRSNARLKMADLPFDISGVAGTYAQIAADPDAHLAAVEGKRALVILDETHHAGDRRAWGEAVQEAFGGARFVLCLSGTPFRQDDCTISMITYRPDGVARADYTYTYATAIAEDVCRPVIFRPYNGLVEYKAKGEQFAASFSDDLPDAQVSALLRHALHPQAGLVEQMVRDADDELSALRSRGPRWQDAAGLLVAMSQAHAYECAKVIREVTGEEPVVVVSDSETAEDDLTAFKNGMGRWIVAVRMISEGVDIPRLMVAVYATNVISTLFFRQFVGRVVRVRHRGVEEVASVFLPADERLCKEATSIEDEVKQFLRDAGAEKFASVRAEVERSQRRLYEVIPTIKNIETGSRTYRGENFTDDELYEANAKRHLFPMGDRFDPIQIAWTLRKLTRGEIPTGMEG